MPQHHGTRSIHPQPAIFGYIVGVEEGEEVRKLLPRRFVPGTALVTQGPGAQRRLCRREVDTCRDLGYTTGGWFVERGAYLTLASEVCITSPRSSSFLRGRNVGHFQTRP